MKSSLLLKSLLALALLGGVITMLQLKSQPDSKNTAVSHTEKSSEIELARADIPATGQTSHNPAPNTSALPIPASASGSTSGQRLKHQNLLQKSAATKSGAPVDADSNTSSVIANDRNPVMEGSQFGTSGLVAGAAIPGSGTTENAGGEPSSDSITPEESLATSDIPIPAGAIAPAAFYDTDAKTPQQQRALNQIVGNFEKDIAEGAGQGLSETELWEAARRMADERYLTLFGWQAYNARHFQSAKQALAEKRTLQTAQ